MIKLTFASCVAIGCLIASAQCDPAAIRLLPQRFGQIRTEGLPASAKAVLARIPDNAHHFGAAAVGKPTAAQTLTLQFRSNATIARISTTPDFRIIQGGTCLASHAYAGNCSLAVQFMPRGPGPRLGKLTVATSEGRVATFALLGYAYAPAISFTPSLIKTVPATISGSSGLISGAGNLAIDNGDALYIADSGNSAIRYIDSSLIMRTLANPAAPPGGLAVDAVGNVWFSEPGGNAIFEIYNSGFLLQVSGDGGDACVTGDGCFLSSEKVTRPGAMTTSDGNSIFFAESFDGAAVLTTQPQPSTLNRLYDPFPYQTDPAGAFAADSSANLYSSFMTSGSCEIVAQPLYYAQKFASYYVKVAGGRVCGFSGDGGRATGAEIGTRIGQIAFDLAGNMYFTDTANNRVRRVDAATGIIRTIAGNGAVGRKGDGGPATAAALGAPTGLTVDSQGQVYILTPSDKASAGPAQVVRELIANGALSFPSQAHGTVSAALVVNVANTGTSPLSFNTYRITGPNAADFGLDPESTNCSFTAGISLNAGQSCQIGVIFTPGATGARSATLKLIDNTINAVDKVSLSGTGTD